MQVYTNYVDWIVVENGSEAQLRAALEDSYGSTDEIDDWIKEGFSPVDDDTPITIVNDADGNDRTIITKTAGEWAKDFHEPALLCSTEY